MALPGAQQALLEAVAAVNSKIIVVLQNGGPLSIDWAASNPSVNAILEAFQPGQLGGDAILNILQGTSVPSGKMPYTTYTEAFSSRRDIREFDLRVNGGLTSWWSTQPTLWPLGYGLSYTSFSYAWSDGIHDITIAHTMSLASPGIIHSPAALLNSVVVTNTGTLTADCVVLAFLTAVPGSPDNTPLKKLFGFERLFAMLPGENRTVSFITDAMNLANADASGHTVLTAGMYGLEIGDVITPAQRTIHLVGPNIELRKAFPIPKM